MCLGISNCSNISLAFSVYIILTLLFAKLAFLNPSCKQGKLNNIKVYVNSCFLVILFEIKQIFTLL